MFTPLFLPGPRSLRSFVCRASKKISNTHNVERQLSFAERAPLVESYRKNWIEINPIGWQTVTLSYENLMRLLFSLIINSLSHRVFGIFLRDWKMIFCQSSTLTRMRCECTIVIICQWLKGSNRELMDAMSGKLADEWSSSIFFLVTSESTRR